VAGSAEPTLWTRRGWLGAATASALGGAACSRGDAHTLRFWAMGREGEVAAQLIAGFEQENPGIRVRIEQLPWSAAHEKLLTAFAGDATPDVTQLGNTWLPEFVALGALAPLDARVQASREVVAADYFQGIWDTNVVDGHTWGLPWYVDTRLLFYRRDLLAQAGFDAPPRDWAEWHACWWPSRIGWGRTSSALLLPLNEYDPLVALSLQQDEALLRDGGRYGNFRSAGFRRTLHFYLSMYERQLAPPASSNEIANVWNEFGRGYFSFYITGPWNIGEFRRRLPAALQSSWATAPLPGPNGPGASIAGGSSLAVFKRSDRQDAAWKLVEYLSRPAVQQRFHAITGNLPPRRSSWEHAALRDDVHTRAFREQLERVKPVPKVPEWERIATELRIVLERVIHGDIPAARLPEEMDKRADRLLAKRRWMLERQGPVA
jgi:multiple sugar transport system substrate-binding protein